VGSNPTGGIAHFSEGDMARAATMTKQATERLRAERAILQAQYDALGNQIKGLDRAISLLDGDASAGLAPSTPPTPPRRARMPIKDLVLGMVSDHAADGMNATQVVETAAQQGVALDRASVSSLLSRLKKDGVLSHDGSVYHPVRSGSGVTAVPPPRKVA
jgi:hypothetical protein